MDKQKRIEISFEGDLDSQLQNFLKESTNDDVGIFRKESHIKGGQPSVGKEVVDLVIEFLNTKAAGVIGVAIITQLFSLLRKKGIKHIKTKRKKYSTSTEGESDFKENELPKEAE